jgi:hypothetical protein
MDKQFKTANAQTIAMRYVGFEVFMEEQLSFGMRVSNGKPDYSM